MRNRKPISRIAIPDLSLVVLMGASGSGKSTFARRFFKPTEILSSDVFRGLVADDENDQSATKDAFETLHFVLEKRLAAGRLTVVDATNVQPEARKPLLEIARRQHCFSVAIALDLSEGVCQERNRERLDRSFGPHVVRNQRDQLRRSLRFLEKEGFRHTFVLSSPGEVDAVELVRQPLWNNRKEERGPFDIVGDIHGCLPELLQLFGALGYAVRSGEDGHPEVSPPSGRKAIFLGDLVDRGPDTPGVLRLAQRMVAAGTALCVPGNHDVKLVKALQGRQAKVSHGLAESLAQLELESDEFRTQAKEFLDGLVSHYVLDGGNLVVAHAGLKESMQGRSSGAVRAFALFGDTTGETDDFGLPVRLDWAADYRGRAQVIYGHTPVAEPEWVNRTLNIDTGCVFGGRLTALRYPERELVSVPALRTYYEPARPLPQKGAPGPSSTRPPQLLDLDDVNGKRTIETRLRGRITLREENAAAALEAMSRFAVDPRWLIYLPPTMSPSETSGEPDLLEHPREALAYYAERGTSHVLLEEKHMGSRAVLVLCRDPEAARRRFGIESGELGVCTTRTGRRFFGPERDAELIAALVGAVTACGLWEELQSDWLCLDAEILPWSAKAEELVRLQYAPVGTAGRLGLASTIAQLARAEARTLEIPGLAELLAQARARAGRVDRYAEAYRRYCWPVRSLADLRVAPFHLLASEGAVHADKTHLWHLGALQRLADAAPGLVLATPHLQVDLADPASQERGIEWWRELTGRGGEGVVVKPLDFVERGNKGLLQPALKCRGREYLRIIYGPEYTAPDQLPRLRKRAVAAKRSLALREFALGLEALERFVAGEPLYRVHECVFGVLALESEPIDPRL